MSKVKGEGDTNAINNALRKLQKAREKLQSLGVLVNTTYCLPHSGAFFSVGWDSMAKLITNAVNNKDEMFEEQKKQDLAKLNTGQNSSCMSVCAIFPTLPPAKDSSRDEMRPLLLEMIRVSQCKGMSLLFCLIQSCILFYKSMYFTIC